MIVTVQKASLTVMLPRCPAAKRDSTRQNGRDVCSHRFHEIIDTSFPGLAAVTDRRQRQPDSSATSNSAPQTARITKAGKPSAAANALGLSQPAAINLGSIRSGPRTATNQDCCRTL